MFQRTAIGLATTSFLLLATSADAACVAGTCGLLGNARIHLNSASGAPAPITLAPPPTGAVRETPAATIMQGAGPTPSLMFGGGELTTPANPNTLPVHLFNPLLFQIRTSVGVSLPGAPATLAAGGRTGPATASWCPGFALPAPAFNPGCANPALGVGVKGRLRYQATVNQFGGPAGALISGSADFAFRGGSLAPCTFVGTPNCVASFAIDALPSTAAAGAGWGFTTTVLSVPNPGGIARVNATAAGLITAVGPALGSAAGLGRTSYGGPWTTGMLTVSVTPFTVFMFSGTDLRSPGGSGVISLVAGGVARRTLGGVFLNNQAQVSYMTLMVPEPRAAAGTAVALLALVGCHGLFRRRAARSPRAN